ncbi:MAG TPA: F0F1 ATP synthase subunit delta [Solirubrobacteraceae bacterium]|nr:F0F1 ATP synthase subunit delta [Solirubrobacteraceae bacterium]
MMRSASRQALAALREREDEVLGARASVATLTAVADELYAVAALLVAQPRLRRTLGDPAATPERRAGLLQNLLEGKVGRQALDIASTAVSERWSTPWDLTDALESAGDDALFAAAEKDGSFDRIEDELFRFERIAGNEGELAVVLDETTVPASRRVEFLDRLVADKVSPITLALLRHAVASQRKRNIELAIDDLLERAAQHRHRSVARVISAVPLSEQQEDRLARALSDLYGRPISVRSALDPDIRGGLVVRVGDEIIDGSVAGRFAAARAAVAG